MSGCFNCGDCGAALLKGGVCSRRCVGRGRGRDGGRSRCKEHGLLYDANVGCRRCSEEIEYGRSFGAGCICKIHDVMYHYDDGCAKCKGCGGVASVAGEDNASSGRVRNDLVVGKGLSGRGESMEVDGSSGFDNVCDTFGGLCGVVGIDEPLKMGCRPIMSKGVLPSVVDTSMDGIEESRLPSGGISGSRGTSGHLEGCGLFDDEASVSTEEESNAEEEVFDLESRSIPMVSPLSVLGREGVVSLVCENCRRKDYSGSIGVDNVLVVKGEVGIGFSKLLCSFRKERGRDCYCLCNECRNYLVKDESKPRGKQYQDGSDKWVNTWPAYMWGRVLGADSVVAERGISFVWRFVPLDWRRWWLPSVQGVGYFGAERLTLESPSCYFTSVDEPMSEFLAWKEKKTAKLLEAYWKKNPVGCIRCPWGCSGYYHKAGGVAFDHVIRRYLSSDVRPQSFDVKGLSDGGRKNENCLFKFERLLYGARADFLCAGSNTCESKRATILDGGWERVAGVYMSPNGPMVLTCQRHDGGDYQKYVHVPTNPVNGSLPDRDPDQLACTIIKPWQLKFDRKTSKGQSFEVREIRGGFSGLDTCDVSCKPRFDYKSWIGHLNDYLGLNFSCNAYVQLDEYVERGDLVPHVAEELRDGARHFIVDWNVRKVVVDTVEVSTPSSVNESLFGGSYVPVNDAIGMQKMVGVENVGKDVHFNPIVDSRWRPPLVYSHTVEETSYFTLNYPLRLYCCNEYGMFGQEPPCIRHKLDVSGIQDSRLLWLLLSLFTSVPICWKNLVESVERTDRWHGWFLAFATHHCLKDYRLKRSKSDNPYRNVLTPVGMAKKLFVAVAGLEGLVDGEEGGDEVVNLDVLFSPSDLKPLLSSVVGIVVKDSSVLAGGVDDEDDVDMGVDDGVPC